jgi:cobalamin biosynthesis protein CobT
MAGHEVTVDWTGFDADKLTNEAVAPYPRECITMKDWKVLAKEGSPHHVDGYAARRAKDPESGFQLWHDDTRGHRALANNIRRYLMTLKRSKWQKERTTGRKINKRGLSRLATGSSDYNKRIFQRRIDHDDMDTAIMLLVDWSGSMHGLRSMLANLAAQRVNAVFGDALNLPLKIMTHTTRAVSGSDSMLNMELGTIKDWKDPRPSSREIADRFIRAAQEGMNTNADGDALMYARAELMKRPERRKILIILSDGQPSAHYLHRSKGTASAPGGRTASGFTLDNLSLKRYRSAALLKQVVKELAADTDVDFYAIGIGRTVKLGGFYGKENTQSIADLDCLNDVLLKTMRDCMLTAMKVD